VFALGYVNLLDAGARVPFTVHDEAICEVDKDDKVDDIIACMTQTPEWLPGCPIACEAVEADYYKK